MREVFESTIGFSGATPDDNLASIGGNSLHAVDIALEIEKRFGVRLPQEEFNAAGSIRDLARWIAREKASGRAKETVPSKDADLVNPELIETAGVLDFGEFHNMLALPDFDARESRLRRSELLAAFEERRPPDAGGSLSAWAGALNVLFFSGRFDVLAHAAPHFHARSPSFAYARSLCAFLDRLPPVGAGVDEFRDDPAKPVQVARRGGADAVVLCFCDTLNALGMPLAAIHRWMGRLDASIVYLRDFRRDFYLSGIDGLGSDHPATVAALRELISSLGARRVACYGSSAGVFAALRYGVDLEAQSVLALGGPTNLTLDFNAHLRWGRAARRLHARFPAEALDLRLIFRQARQPPRSLLVYADSDWDDRIQMEWMGGLPSVALRTVDNYDGHNVVIEVVKRGEFESLLEAMVPD